MVYSCSRNGSGVLNVIDADIGRDATRLIIYLSKNLLPFAVPDFKKSGTRVPSSALSAPKWSTYRLKELNGFLFPVQT